MRKARFAAAVVLAWTCAASAAEPPIAVFGCSGCHATDAKVETPVPRLIGRPAAETVKAMQEFRDGQRPGTVMDRLAKGFTDQEVQAIAAWYAEQK
jgi:cytochrome subunit of sulfide dehydrogenase